MYHMYVRMYVSVNLHVLQKFYHVVLQASLDSCLLIQLGIIVVTVCTYVALYIRWLLIH